MQLGSGEAQHTDTKQPPPDKSRFSSGVGKCSGVTSCAIRRKPELKQPSLLFLILLKPTLLPPRPRPPRCLAVFLEVGAPVPLERSFSPWSWKPSPGYNVKHAENQKHALNLQWILLQSEQRMAAHTHLWGTSGKNAQYHTKIKSLLIGYHIYLAHQCSEGLLTQTRSMPQWNPSQWQWPSSPVWACTSVWLVAGKLLQLTTEPYSNFVQSNYGNWLLA